MYRGGKHEHPWQQDRDRYKNSTYTTKEASPHLSSKMTNSRRSSANVSNASAKQAAADALRSASKTSSANRRRSARNTIDTRDNQAYEVGEIDSPGTINNAGKNTTGNYGESASRPASPQPAGVENIPENTPPDPATDPHEPQQSSPTEMGIENPFESTLESINDGDILSVDYDNEFPPLQPKPYETHEPPSTNNARPLRKRKVADI